MSSQTIHPALALVVTGSLALACGGARTQPASAPPPDSADKAGDSDAGAPREKPFAGSAAEATQLVSAAIDEHGRAVAACVEAYRERKKIGHQRVQIQVGIDQEGNLIGVALPKGQKDEQLSSCVQDALRDALFPRSHAGVITLTRTFEEIPQ